MSAEMEKQKTKLFNLLVTSHADPEKLKEVYKDKEGIPDSLKHVVDESIDRTMGCAIMEKVAEAVGEERAGIFRNVFRIMAKDAQMLLAFKTLTCFILRPAVEELLSSRTAVKTLSQIKEASDESR